MVLFFFILFLPISLFADPIALRVQHPIYLQSIAMPPTSAQVLKKGVFEFSTTHAYSNVYERVIYPDVDINIDLEVYRLGLEGKIGIGRGWEIGCEMPFLKFYGGFLDNFVQGFHDFFSFPNGGRNLVRNGAFFYDVTAPGFDYGISDERFGIGDLTLNVKYQLFAEGAKRPALAFLTALKLPSGEEMEGLGSGNPGLGFGLAMEKSYNRLRLFSNFRFLIDGGPEVLQSYWQTHQFLYSFSGEFRIWKNFSGVMQLDGGTPLLNNIGFETWNGAPLDFILGLNGTYKNWFGQLAFSEDILAIGPSIDFTLFLKLGFRFKG